jgi:hypothetical protein
MMLQSTYLDFMVRMLVLCNWIMCPKLVVCSANADLSQMFWPDSSLVHLQLGGSEMALLSNIHFTTPT